MAYAQPIPAHLAHQSTFASLELGAVLDDLAARFIVNLPAEELESMDRVCFQIEQAHWYYEDFVRPMASNPSLLPSYTLKAFSLLIFKSCPLLHDLVPQHAQIWTSFMQYKERVPVCGAVLINEWWDKVLLVKGWTKGSSWSFPRGKINKEEPEAMCAVREVLEETGYDLTANFPPAQLHPSYVECEGHERVPYYVELVIREQKIRLYFIPGVSERTRFETRTRKEISKIEWFSLSDLPTWSKEVASGGAGGSKKGKGAARTKSELANGRQAKFYMVTPFISHLRLWIDRNKPRNLPPRPAASSLSPFPAPARAPSPEGSPVLFGGRVLRPWTEDDATSHLPSEGEHADGEESTEDESAVEDERIRRAVPPHLAQQQQQQRSPWETMQQGTDALQALFFGASDSPPAPPPPIRPLPVPTQQHATPVPSTSSAAGTVTATPPHVAYERQQSFLQPVPKPSNQQSKLLELLGGAPSGAPTPPPPPPPQPQYHQPPTQYPQHMLAHRLESLTLATPSPLAYLPTASASAPAHTPLSPATVAAAQPAPPQAFAALEDDQKREKHDALLRALLSVAAKSPPRAPAQDLPREVEPAPALSVGKGSLLSILNGAQLAPAPAPALAPKDPLQVVREYRAAQQGAHDGSPADAPAPHRAPSPLPLPGSAAPHLVALHHPKPIPPPTAQPVSAYSSPTTTAAVAPPHPHAYPLPHQHQQHAFSQPAPPSGHFAFAPAPGQQQPAPLHVPYPPSSTISAAPQGHAHPHPNVLQHPAPTQILAPYPQQQPQQHFHPHMPFSHPPLPPHSAAPPPPQQQPPHPSAAAGGPWAPPPQNAYAHAHPSLPMPFASLGMPMPLQHMSTAMATPQYPLQPQYALPSALEQMQMGGGGGGGAGPQQMGNGHGAQGHGQQQQQQQQQSQQQRGNAGALLGLFNSR
ncbi:hypothetical protein JCM9279_003978 [Rhodotorula babjevae]